MGFDPEAGHHALMQVGGSVQRASEYLLAAQFNGVNVSGAAGPNGGNSGGLNFGNFG
eukprot:CAMPEP_0181381162 /NCGR_PEP_ID=MMETSP1106-20121128/19968_1 /TAXON_ID=81844 /ORGANISM="Mantoniella antarctica, Strain SL-175" /LENGTH=56 /DNA_ID=CAMNT_0023500315 /DNA_START=1 /DNA_END=168 /DNA_ORIENTATION=+